MFVLGLQLPVYVVTTSENDYLYQENLPALTKFTICFWFKGQPDDDNRDEDFLISIATSGNILFIVLVKVFLLSSKSLPALYS